MTLTSLATDGGFEIQNLGLSSQRPQRQFSTVYISSKVDHNVQTPTDYTLWLPARRCSALATDCRSVLLRPRIFCVGTV